MRYYNYFSCKYNVLVFHGIDGSNRQIVFTRLNTFPFQVEDRLVLFVTTNFQLLTSSKDRDDFFQIFFSKT